MAPFEHQHLLFLEQVVMRRSRLHAGRQLLDLQANMIGITNGRARQVTGTTPEALPF
jgi:hypothetical protein